MKNTNSSILCPQCGKSKGGKTAALCPSCERDRRRAPAGVIVACRECGSSSLPDKDYCKKCLAYQAWIKRRVRLTNEAKESIDSRSDVGIRGKKNLREKWQNDHLE